MTVDSIFEVIGATSIRFTIRTRKNIDVKHSGEAKSSFAKAFIYSGLRPPKYDVALATADEGGGGGIRTHEELAPLAVFKTAALDQLCDPS